MMDKVQKPSNSDLFSSLPKHLPEIELTKAGDEAGKPQ
jgi:hypothetical protein